MSDDRRRRAFSRTEPKTEFAALLRDKRLAQGLTNRQIEELGSFPYNNYGMWERGDSLPPMKHLPRLIKVLNISPDEFVDNIGWFEYGLIPQQKSQKIASLLRDLLKEASDA